MIDLCANVFVKWKCLPAVHCDRRYSNQPFLTFNSYIEIDVNAEKRIDITSARAKLHAQIRYQQNRHTDLPSFFFILMCWNLQTKVEVITMAFRYPCKQNKTNTRKKSSHKQIGLRYSVYISIIRHMKNWRKNKRL